MTTVKVSIGGRIKIPKPLRDEFGIKPRSKVKLISYGGILSIVPQAEDPVNALHGMLAEGPSLTRDLLNERARDKSIDKQ